MKVLTYHYIRNNGAVLFADALLRLLRGAGLSADLLNYRAPRVACCEALKRFKLRWPAPLFYARRDRTFLHYMARSFPEAVGPAIRSRAALRAAVPAGKSVLAAMDVWNVNQLWTDSPFPSVYWLSDFSERGWLIDSSTPHM